MLFFAISCSSKKGRIEIINDESKAIDYCTGQMFEDTINIEEDSVYIYTKIRHIPLYVGKDTCIIDFNKLTLIDNFIHDIGKGSKQRKYYTPDSINAEVYLDTMINVNYRSFKTYNYIQDFGVCDCKGYAFFIKNTSKDTLILGEGENIPIVMQGMNLSGKWEDLHEPSLYMDNYGIGFLLPPGNIALFSIPKIKSKKYSKYRVKYRKYLSSSYNCTS